VQPNPPPAPEGEGVDFDAVIDDVLDSLPDPFFEQLETVAIVVEDEPSPRQLAAAHAAGLYGLYTGIPRTRYGADNAAMPSKISIFRGPLSRSHPDPVRLRLAIERTLLHEIAHHLGVDDDRIRELVDEGRASRLDGRPRRAEGPG
jgi:predicted Zn-dependent protease with MMP-like domain